LNIIDDQYFVPTDLWRDVSSDCDPHRQSCFL